MRNAVTAVELAVVERSLESKRLQANVFKAFKLS